MQLTQVITDQLRIRHWAIEPGQCWAVLARNGAGKQMLTGVLTGDITPDEGAIKHDFHRIRVLSFEAQQALYEHELKLDDTDFMDHLDPGTTVRELLSLEDGIPGELAFLKLERILDRGYRLLSSGEGRKALLAQVFLEQPDFLILDEPYDSLDINARADLQAFFSGLLASGKTQLLFLFNKVDEINNWHTHVAVMEQGEFIAQGEKSAVLDDPAIASLLSFDPTTLPPWPDDLVRQEGQKGQEEKADQELATPLVSLSKGKVQYGTTVIFSDLDLRINQGDHTLLTGSNGSGKSTLLDLVTGDHPQCYGNDLQVLGYQRGSGESIWEIKKQIGIVSPGLHRDHRVPGSALHIALSGFFDTIGLYDAPDAIQIEHARRWLALVGMQGNSSTPFKQLSYGEQRLVLVARALVKQPALLILDEPTQGLDDVNRHRVMYFLEHLSSQQRTTIIMASHRQDERLPLFVHHVSMSEG